MTSRASLIARDIDRGASALACAVLLTVMSMAGCATSRVGVADAPRDHQVRTERLIVRCDFPIEDDDPLVNELHDLRREVRETLGLPEMTRPVVVYLFRDEDRYRGYMRAVHPTLPDRRAFFIGTPSELAVYAYWGAQVREDLRHEYTHGILHACLSDVPLWLDEGIAEYFEVRDSRGGRLNLDHTRGLAQMLANGWEPDLQRLEQLDDVGEMQRADYQEAWAWVHYLMQESDVGRLLLVDYLRNHADDIRPSLGTQIAAEIPNCGQRLKAYLGSLDVGRSVVSFAR